MNPDLSLALRRVLDLIDEHGHASASVLRARDRLMRDLLPRTVDGSPYLVAGIVGPNNSGKSALFNGLVGTDLSPSLPTGGATKRLYGAASSTLLERMAADQALERFSVLRASSLSAEAVEENAATTEDPSELLAFEVDLPDGLLLIDTPDFDSILEENRHASESLLAVADLAIAVVTKHTYQNREVVHYLERWLSHGRPWLLVYNEAPSHELALEHAKKLSEDLGSAPLAVFSAPHSLDVQESRGTLDPVAQIDGKSVALREFLFDLERVGQVKQRALEASLAQLADDLSQWIRELNEEAEVADELLIVAEKHVAHLAAKVAGCAMPGGPFIEAFRAVLDRRSNAFSRGWRMGLRKVRLKIESIPAFFSSRSEPEREEVRESLADVERAEFESAWPAFWEDLMRDLGPEGRSLSGEDCAIALAISLEGELTEARADELRSTASVAIGASSVDLEAFQDVCEVLVEQAIAERGRDWDIQAAVDVTMLAPIAIATAVIIKTGGLGSDMGVAGGAALSSYLSEKYSHLLGTQITNEAARRWAESRRVELAPVVLESVLPKSGALMRETKQLNRNLMDELTELRAKLVS